MFALMNKDPYVPFIIVLMQSVWAYAFAVELPRPSTFLATFCSTAIASSSCYPEDAHANRHDYTCYSLSPHDTLALCGSARARSNDIIICSISKPSTARIPFSHHYMHP